MLILKNARIVTPAEVVEGSLTAEHGTIDSVDAGNCGVSGGVDCDSDYVLAGAIDIHTDAVERHLNPRPSVRWPVRAALAAHDAQIVASGITTVFDSLALGVDLEDQSRSMDIIRSAIAAIVGEQRELFRAEHFLHLRLELPHPETISYCEEFIDLPSVRLFSLMDHSPGQGQFLDVQYLKSNIRRQTTEEEFEAQMARRLDMRERYAESNRRTLAALVRERGLPLASHDDRTIEEVERASDLGSTISEFPVTLEAAEAAHARGMAVVMGGPNLVLGGSHSGNASASEVARRAWLDVLTSDYVPASLLHGVFLVAEQLGLPLPEAVGMATWRAAEAVGLADRGALRPGLRADLVRVRVLDGQPAVVAVWRKGQQVY